jgi:hypothetical protein
MDVENLKQALDKAGVDISDMMEVFNARPQHGVRISEEDRLRILRLLQAKNKTNSEQEL